MPKKTNTSSPWNKWREENREKHRHRVTLEDIDLPDFWMEFWIPREVTPVEMATMEQTVSENHRTWLSAIIDAAISKTARNSSLFTSSIDNTEGEVENSEVSELEKQNPLERPARVEEIATVGIDSLLLLRAWNLTDPDTDEPLPVPYITAESTSEDFNKAAEILQKLPMPVIYKIREGAEEAAQMVIPLVKKGASFVEYLRAVDQVNQA